MRMRAKKSRKARKPAVAKYFGRFTRSARHVSTRTLVMGVCAIFGAAMLIGAATSGAPDAAATHAAAKPATTAAAATVAGASADPVVPPVVPTAADAVATAGVKTPVKTITGCLAREDAAYRLKDTAGEQVPKTRSWKSGFLKKGPAPIDLYDTSNHLKLPTHVGQRVTVTGELVDRQMYVRSLQRVSASCTQKS